MSDVPDAVQADADMTVFILDNGTVAMTGTQESFTTGERLLRVLRGLGVSEEHLHVIEPLNRLHAENVELIRREIDPPGLSVVVPTRACIHLRRKLREQTPALV